MGAMDSDAIKTGMIPASKEFAVCWGVGREMEKEHQKMRRLEFAIRAVKETNRVLRSKTSGVYLRKDVGTASPRKCH